MDNLHLHHVFQEIASRLQCPACTKRIPVQKVSIVSLKGSNTVFHAQCPHCKQSMNISAVIESTTPSIKKEAISQQEILNFSHEISSIHSLSSYLS